MSAAPPPSIPVAGRVTSPGLPSGSTGLVQYVKRFWDSVQHTLIVVGGALIVFASARNTITWYFQRFWGFSGDFWQRNWEYVHDLAGGDPFTLYFYGTIIVTNAAYFSFNIFLMILDTTGKPKFLLKYKIQDDKQVDKKKLKKAVFWVLFNQTVIAIPFIYYLYFLLSWRGCDFGREVPTFHWVLLELCVFSLVEELVFYYSHRLLHHPRLYKHIHKMHHEWTAPVGITAIYAHPIEHMLSNMLPPGLGPLLMGSHIGTAWLWFTIAYVSTTISHCGYHLPYLPSPEAHDFHHLKFVNNFGVLGILDRLHGTDSMFRASKAYERHFLLLALTPASVQYPEDPKSPREKQKPE